jgi:predicted nucleotidyltransferase
MSRLFTSRYVARVLAALALHAHPPLRKNELVRITGLSWSAIQRAVASLRDRELILVHDSKGYESYEVDPASAYRRAIRLAALVDGGIAEALAPVASRLRFAMVIGSFAWGDPTPASDIDLLVVGGTTRDEIEALLRPLGERYERTFDPIVFTDEEMHQRLAHDDYLLRNAIAGGVRIMGNPSLVPA